MANASVHGAVGFARTFGVISQKVKYSDFTASSAAGYLDLTKYLPKGALVLGWVANVTKAFTGDTTGTLQVGTSGDADCFSGLTTNSVYTAAMVGSVGNQATPIAGQFVATAIQPRLTITGSSAWTNVTAGELEIYIFFAKAPIKTSKTAP